MIPGSFPSSGSPNKLETSKAFKLEGFETINDKVLKEMNERAKGITHPGFTPQIYSPPTSAGKSSSSSLTATAAAAAARTTPKRGHHKRYSSIHRRNFAKMDSISSHYAARSRREAEERQVNETELNNDTKKGLAEKRTSSRVVTNASKRRRMDFQGRKLELRSSVSKTNLAKLAREQEESVVEEEAEEPMTKSAATRPLFAPHTNSNNGSTGAFAPHSNTSRTTTATGRRIISGKPSYGNETGRSIASNTDTSLLRSLPDGSRDRHLSPIHDPSKQSSSLSPVKPSSPLKSAKSTSSLVSSPKKRAPASREALCPTKRVEQLLNRLPPPPTSSSAKTIRKSPSIAHLESTNSTTKPTRIPRIAAASYAAPTASSLNRLTRTARSSPNLKALAASRSASRSPTRDGGGRRVGSSERTGS